MRFRYLAWYMSAAGFGALLAGCSGGGSQSTSGSLPQSIGRSTVLGYSVAMPLARLSARRGTKPTPFVNVAAVERSGRNLLALSDADANAVYISDASGGLSATLTTGLNYPQGLALDTNGTLYVANTGNSQVLVYAKPYTGPSIILKDPGQFPAGVAVASDGTVGVTNMSSTSHGAGSVSIYAKGATSPCATVSNGSFASLYFDAFDKTGNLYVDGTNASGKFVVGEVRGKCGATAIAPLSIHNTINSPGGVAVLASGGVVLGDQTGLHITSIVYTYKPPVHGSLGSPTKTTTLPAVYDGVDFAFKPFDQRLWIADAGAMDFAEFSYPAGTPITALPDYELPVGIATYPSQP